MLRAILGEKSMVRTSIAAIALTGVFALSANAASFNWNWSSPSDAYKLSNGTGTHSYTSPEGVEINDTGGEIRSINSSFDDGTGMLTWLVTLGPSPIFSTPLTSGFTLALTDGPNPKGIDGELALLYFDAYGSSPVLTAYGYNAQNDGTSYRDGSNANGTQAPDRIFSSILNNQVVLVDTFNQDGTRTLGFTIDSSLINAHSPAYGNPNDWTGIQFGSSIGMWFHPFLVTEGTYSQGYLTNWRTEVGGWFDGNEVPTVPEPSTAILALAGLATIGYRRRRSMR